MASSITLGVPAEAAFARTVRMTAANLAVVMGLDVEEVEDIRIAAEEGFVYACATRPQECAMTFELSEGEMRMSFSLGDADLDDPADSGVGESDLELVELLLDAVCDELAISEDGRTLRLVKKVVAHAG